MRVNKMNEETEYWKEKYQQSQMVNAKLRKDQIRMEKFKIVELMEKMFTFLDLPINNDEDVVIYNAKAKDSLVAYLKGMINNELGHNHYKGE